MAVSPESVRTLRDRTGAGIMDCKNAIETADGDLDRAEAALRQQGMAKAASKSGRKTAEGVVECYVHAGKRVCAMVEVNCETDFVARTQDFNARAHNLAMQIAAIAPPYVDTENMTADETRTPERGRRPTQPFSKGASYSDGHLRVVGGGRRGWDGEFTTDTPGRPGGAWLSRAPRTRCHPAEKRYWSTGECHACWTCW